MKRFGYLWEDMISVTNLYLAYKKARKGKQKRNEVALFSLNLEKELGLLHDQLKAKTYRPGKFREDSSEIFKDQSSGNGFLHDVERENLQSSKARRYPIKNVH